MTEPDVPTTAPTAAGVPRERGLLLREAVRRHAAGEHRRRFAPVLHVGRPGVREQSTCASLTSTDHALRCDLVSAMVAACGEAAPLLWLTRAGGLESEDLDVAWAAAVRAVAAETGRALPYATVTRHGWRDPVTGTGRTWRRIRS